jgi:hypothetical protein
MRMTSASLSIVLRLTALMEGDPPASARSLRRTGHASRNG